MKRGFSFGRTVQSHANRRARRRSLFRSQLQPVFWGRFESNLRFSTEVLIMAVSLTDLVGKLEKRVNELRRAGDAAALLSAARDAADQVEHRVTDPPGDDEQREALMVLQRLTFNAAADCWPGWDPSKEAPSSHRILAARELTQYSDLL